MILIQKLSHIYVGFCSKCFHNKINANTSYSFDLPKTPNGSAQTLLEPTSTTPNRIVLFVSLHFYHFLLKQIILTILILEFILVHMDIIFV